VGLARVGVVSASLPSDRPTQQPPPVQRVRIRYAKRGRLRFTSHRDIARAVERAVRRARIPVALSSGFNPHPRISYAGAAPTGAASEAEYLEIALAQRCDPTALRTALDAALPPGLDIVAAVTSGPGSLADRLQASHWQLELRGVSAPAAQAAVDAFLAAAVVEVSRETKRGLRRFDARGAVVSLAVSRTVAAESADQGFDHCATLEMVVRQQEPAVRPDDVLAGLRQIAGLDVPAAPLVRRVAQGPLDLRAGTVGDPLVPDRDTSLPSGQA